MPNLKIYVDDQLFAACRDRLAAALAPLRDRLCRDLAVPAAACQFAVLPVLAMADLPPVNVELQILPGPERSRDRLAALATTLRDSIAAATGTAVAVRISQLDPATYVALK